MTPGPQYAWPGHPAEAHQTEVAWEYPQRAEELGRELGTPEGVEGPMTEEMGGCPSPSPAPLP